MILLELLAACQKTKAPVPDFGPVGTIMVRRRDDEVSRTFRINGHMLERPVNVGDRVKPGQVVAWLDPPAETAMSEQPPEPVSTLKGAAAEWWRGQ
jgi:membrane fusion protein, multidrug efflux system